MIERICSWLCDWDTKLLIARHLAYKEGYGRGFDAGRHHTLQAMRTEARALWGGTGPDHRPGVAMNELYNRVADARQEKDDG